jgi:hypothetical protein
MSEFKVKKAIENLHNVSSWENLLSIPKKFNINLERVRERKDWFNFINTTKFCNYYVSMNGGNFTSIERNFRTIRAQLRTELKAQETNSENTMSVSELDSLTSAKVS